MAEIHVGMGEMALGFEGDTLTSLGLGSCVAVNLYDPVKRIGGAAHVMLPDSTGAHLQPPERTVIIADADPGVRRQILHALAGSPYTVKAETSEHEETLALWRKHKPAVTLLSAFLPPADGTKTLKTMRQVDQEANIILISPAVDRETVLSYLSTGAQEVLTDPFTGPKILASLEYVVHRRVLKYADRAIPMLKAKMVAIGATERNLVAKIVGGAHMFPTIDDEQVLQIGRKNVLAVKELLAREGIPIIAEETGAHVGRTARFDVGTGEVRVTTKDSVKTL